MIPNLPALMPLIRPLMDAGCAIDIALPAGSFAARVVYYIEKPKRLHLYDSKGKHVVVFI